MRPFASTTRVAALPTCRAEVPQDLDQGRVPDRDGDHDRPHRWRACRDETVFRAPCQRFGQGLDRADPVDRHRAQQLRRHKGTPWYRGTPWCFGRHAGIARRHLCRAHHRERGQRCFRALRRLGEPYPGGVGPQALACLRRRRLRGNSELQPQRSTAAGEKHSEAERGEDGWMARSHRTPPAGSITRWRLGSWANATRERRVAGAASSSSTASRKPPSKTASARTA